MPAYVQFIPISPNLNTLFHTVFFLLLDQYDVTERRYPSHGHFRHTAAWSKPAHESETIRRKVESLLKGKLAPKR